MGAIDVNGDAPPGFVPQSITDARRGIYTYYQWCGGRPGTPNNQWNNPVIPLASSSGLALIYGNPITLERDEEAAGYPATTPSRPQSLVGTDWSAPLAALNPPIFSIAVHQQPFARKSSFEYTQPAIPRVWVLTMALVAEEEGVGCYSTSWRFR